MNQCNFAVSNNLKIENMVNIKMIGNKIASGRKKLNLSQSQLAQRLFISPQAVGKWERGESMPDITIFNQLAEILNVDLNYFSENYQSASNEILTSETFVNQSSEIPIQKQKEKISWDMSKMNLADSDFSGLKNLNEKLGSSNMQNCKFVGSDLSGLILKRNNVESCDFSKSDFSNCNIHKSNLNKNLFRECSLKETEFLESCLNGCDFSIADFTKAVLFKSFFSGCDFSDTNFTTTSVKFGGIEKCNITNAVLNHTSFIDTYLTDIAFEGILENCHFENCVFYNVKFQNATLVNTFFKNNKKFKKVKFDNCKADKITYAFLKNNQADITGITLLTP
jgi:uncharacterized protein YjbI with pentapeptide repeats